MSRCIDCGKPVRQALRCLSCHHAYVGRLADELRTCPQCGGPRYPTSALCRTCYSKSRVGKPRVAEPSKGAGRDRARRAYPLGGCEYEGCDKPAIDRHHIDGNTANNAPENIMRLCRRHHMLIDGRLDRFKAGASNAGKQGGWPKQKRNLGRR